MSIDINVVNGCLDSTIAPQRVMDKNACFMETIENMQLLPELGTDTIHIWGVHIPDVLDQLDRLSALLSSAEQEKAARFYRDADRHLSIAARGALRVLLSGYIGIPATDLVFDYSETGKPFIAGPVSFNISHSGDWVVLAFGRERQIGVDVEKIKPKLDVLAIAARYFTPTEIEFIEAAADQRSAFFQLWVRKEAYVKACGSALFRELSSFSVPLEEQGEKEGWFFQRLEAGSTYASAVVTDQPLASVPCYDFSAMKW